MEINFARHAWGGGAPNVLLSIFLWCHLITKVQNITFLFLIYSQCGRSFLGNMLHSANNQSSGMEKRFKICRMGRAQQCFFFSFFSLPLATLVCQLPWKTSRAALIRNIYCQVNWSVWLKMPSQYVKWEVGWHPLQQQGQNHLRVLHLQIQCALLFTSAPLDFYCPI